MSPDDLRTALADAAPREREPGAPRDVLTCPLCACTAWVPAYRIERVSGVVTLCTSVPASVACAHCGTRRAAEVLSADWVRWERREA